MQELRPLHIDIAISKDGTNGLLFTDDRHIRPEQVGEDPGRRQGGSRCCSFYFHFFLFSFYFIFHGGEGGFSLSRELSKKAQYKRIG